MNGFNERILIDLGQFCMYDCRDPRFPPLAIATRSRSPFRFSLSGSWHAQSWFLAFGCSTSTADPQMTRLDPGLSSRQDAPAVRAQVGWAAI